jgi:hypothetical protein
VSRRAAEAALYLTPDDDDDVERMPQAVAPESSLARSPIARSGALTAATGLATGVAAVPDVGGGLAGAGGWLTGAQQLGEQVAGFIGLPPLAIAAVVMVGAGFTVVKWRAKQRDEGWA